MDCISADIFEPAHAEQNGEVKVRIIAYPNLEDDFQLQVVERVDIFKGVKADPKNFTHFLSVCNFFGRYYYGVFPKELYWVKDESKFNTETPISRAY